MVIAQIWKVAVEHKEDSAKANVAITRSIGEISENTDEIANNMDEIKWNQIEQDIRKWFSPPDPSTNHNTACEVYNNVPPTWFFGASIFENWMSNGSLLWVHGKPGSGKSIFCAAIIQHIMKLRDAGNATLAYFYFDFRDEEKQNVRNVVTSLLVQLSAHSKPSCDAIYRLYLTHGKGIQQPSNGILIDRLKEMLVVVAHRPIFVIMDALDESPDLGMPAPREAVLNLIEDLVQLHLQVPNLHICVTSRPEVDIQNKLKPLAVNAISLQDETRQKIVISDYVSTFMSSDEQMKHWRDEDKKLVIEELSERADGMFQWVFCQLETLRHAVQPDVLGILESLPNTLDETYERLLKNINENNRRHARYLLHCLAVSVRPLRVEELAEILTFDFNVAEGSIPNYRPDRRPNDPEAAILSICPNLITIVDNRDSRVVQFSHLSVKEFLTSNHLASTREDLSFYHILPACAHTILAQVCLGFLLHPNDCNDDKSVKDSPLAEYAAQHWVTHAQFEDVANRVTDGIQSLLDPENPHYSAWICLFDPDGKSSGRLPSEIPSPLYYLVLCGFLDLVRHIAFKHPEFMNTTGGLYGFPLDAALGRNNFQVAEILLKYGCKVDVRDARKQTALHKTIDRHDKVAIDVVQFLLDNGADVNAQRDDLRTPLHLALNVGELSVARILLEHQADVNARNDDGQTPLHLLSRWEVPLEKDGMDLAMLFLKCGANVNDRDKDRATPLHLASYFKRLEIVRLLLDHGADTTMENDRTETPLQIVIMGISNAQGDGVDVARLLVEHRAKAYTQAKSQVSTSDLGWCFVKEIGRVLLGDEDDFEAAENYSGQTFQQWIEEPGVDGNVHDKYDTILLHSALHQGSPEMVARLLDQCVKVNEKNHWGETALHVISRSRHNSQGAHAALVLLERGADVNSQRKNNWTPLHVASYYGNLELIRLLLGYGAKADTECDNGENPLHKVSYGKYKHPEDGVSVAGLLLKHGVDVNTRNKDHLTPLYVASYVGNIEIVRLLLDHGADPESNAEGHIGEKPLHQVSYGKYRSPEDGVRVAQLLLERGADVNTRRKDDQTPLHVASYFGNVEIVLLLLDHGADPEAAWGDQEAKPLHRVSLGEYRSLEGGLRVAQLLLDHGTDVNTRRKDNQTPLHLASYFGNFEIVRLLLDRGADLEAEWGDLEAKPLHRVSLGEYKSLEGGIRVAQLLLDRGADVNTRRKDQQTPLHLASYFGNVEIVRLLLKHGADLEAAWGDTAEKPLHRASLGEYRYEEGRCSCRTATP
ncbi:Ankyrin repeat-containing domain protein [Lactarius tabidus]